MTGFDRRSFLKLAGAAASSVLLPGLAQFEPKQTESAPNIIVILFDAMSARNLSVYGYPRPTTTNLERFADRATLYHAHHAGGNYTIPGTASLLTGTYPWTHRAINYGGQVRPGLIGNNIFELLGEEYHRVAFGQNVWAQFLLSQFVEDIDMLLPSGAFSQLDYLIGDRVPRDRNLALRALDDFVFKMEREPASLVFGPLQRALYFRDSERMASAEYPRGLPQDLNYGIYFLLEDLFEGLGSVLQDLPAPYFTYFHLFPPHAPSRPTRKFHGRFLDDWVPVRKPQHRLADGLASLPLRAARRSYDEYIASLDWEFGRLLDAMEAAGVLENSYVVITSDHGEMFERGEKEHATVLLYEPVVHIPLLISSPGQEQRRDIHAPTHAVDVLPTLLRLAGKSVPATSEGQLLPGLGGTEDMERSTFIVEAKNNPAFQPLQRTTIAMYKGNYKLLYYTGYEPEDTFELYNLTSDAEELVDLYPAQPVVARHLRDELMESLLAADEPYRKHSRSDGRGSRENT